MRWSVFFLPLVAAMGCASQSALRGDWCGTERALVREAGDLSEACAAGDFYACAEARVSCERNHFSCASGPPTALDRCVAQERDEGISCAMPEIAPLAAAAAPALEKLCAGGDWRACYEVAEGAERAGGKNVDASLDAACDHGVGAACARAGERAWARGDAAGAIDRVVRACGESESRACDAREAIVSRAGDLESAGRWDELVRVYRVACFRGSDVAACEDLEAFRGRARSVAGECEGGATSRCHDAAAMIRAASQGEADLARARRLETAPTEASAQAPRPARAGDDLDAARRCIDARTEQRGCVVLRASVAADGSVRSPSVEGIGDARTRACVVAAMARWHLEPGVERTFERPLTCGSVSK